MDSEELTWPPQATAQDHLAVAVIWRELEHLLSGQAGPTDMFVRRLEGMLPPLASVPAQQLPSIARIHLQSASHIKATMCMLAPAAFPAAAGEGGEGASGSGPHSDTQHSQSGTLPSASWCTPVDAFAADAVPAAAEAMVVKLINLQVFHLSRAQEVASYMRMHACARAQHAQAQQLAAAAMGAATEPAAEG